MAMWWPWDHQWNFLLGSGPTAACKHGGSLQTALERSAPANLADRLKHKTTEEKQGFHTLPDRRSARVLNPVGLLIFSKF